MIVVMRRSWIRLVGDDVLAWRFGGMIPTSQQYDAFLSF